jgi:hypothetical protein
MTPRHCERSEAIHSFFLLLHGLLRCARNDGKYRYTFAIPRRDAPEVCKKSPPLKTEGVGNAGRPMHPQPRVRILVASMHTSIHSEPSEITRHSRTQWFTAYIVLSPVIGLLTPSSTELPPST